MMKERKKVRFQETEYSVEKILEKRQDKNGCYFYRVQWVGYFKPTWEPVENFVS